MRASLNAVDISKTLQNIDFVFRFEYILFLTNKTCVRNGLCDLSVYEHAYILIENYAKLIRT